MRIVFCVLLWCAAATAFGQEDEDQSKPGKILLSAGVSYGALVSGTQLDYLSYGSGVQFGVYEALELNLRVYPVSFFGFEVSSDIVGVSAGSEATLVTSTLSGGVLLRRLFPLWDEVSCEVFAGGGVNTHAMSYQGGFLQPSLGDVSPGMGFYGKVGGSLYPGRPFFLTAELEYQQLRDTTTLYPDFVGNFVKVNFRAGLHF